MAKKATAGELVSPANLWGKPLPRISTGRPAAEKLEGKGPQMQMKPENEADADDIDSDDAESDAESFDGPTAADEPELEVEEDDETGAELETADEPENKEDDDDNADEDVDVEDFENEEDGDDSVSDAAETSVASAESIPRERKTRTTVKVMEMAEKKTMSDHVRDEIVARKRTGESLRGVDIVAALAKRKIKVSAAQVSQLLKKAGMGGKSRAGRKAASPASPAATSKDHEERSRRANKAKNARADVGGLDLPWSQLTAAKAFVLTCDGSVDTAMSVLTTLQKLKQFVS
jgi:hypothetical protein